MTPSGGAATSPIARLVRDLAEEVHASAADPAARPRLPWAEAVADALTWHCLATSRCDAPRSTSPMTTSDPPGHHSLLTMRHDIGTASNACCSRRPTSAVLFPPTARRCVLVAHRRGGGEASIDDTKGASDERAGDPALAGSGAATPSP